LTKHSAVVALSVVLAAPVLACAGHYRPVLPMSARSDDLRLELRALRILKYTEYIFRSDSASGHTLREAWLTVAGRAPCTGGQIADGLKVDDGEDFALPPGTHQVTVVFEGAPGDGLDVVVDLRMEDGRCARAPAISQSIPLEASQRYTLLLDTTLDGYQTLRGLDDTVGFRLGGGIWLGRTLVTAAAGLGISECEVSTCGPSGNNAKKPSYGLAASADLRYALAPYVFVDGPVLPSLGLRYSYTPVRVPALTGERRFDLHGLHALLCLGIGPGRLQRGPFRRAERTQNMEVAIPVGVVLDPDGPTRKVAFSAGLAFRIQMPL